MSKQDERTPDEDRTAYWGTCDDCLTCIIAYPHPDRLTDIPDDKEWEASFPDCPVCDATLDWEGTDPVLSLVRNY